MLEGALFPKWFKLCLTVFPCQPFKHILSDGQGSKGSMVTPEVIWAAQARRQQEQDGLQRQSAPALWWQPRKPECKQERQQIESDKTDSHMFLLLDAVGQNSRFPSLLPWICIYCLLPGHVSLLSRKRFAGGWLPSL